MKACAWGWRGSQGRPQRLPVERSVRAATLAMAAGGSESDS